MSEPEQEPEEGAELDETTDADGVSDDEAAEQEEAAQEREPEPDADADAILRAQSEREMEKKLRALDREAVAHAARVEKIMGDDFESVVGCPLCAPNIPGFRFPFPPQPEVVAAVKEAIGEPASPAYSRDSYSRACELCGGLGSVSTGSKVAGQGVVSCLTCKGRGWVPIGPERETGAITPPNGAVAPVDYGATTPPDVLPPEAEALKALGYIVVAPIQAQV